VNLPVLSPMLNPVRDYDWGSDSALARLQGRTPSGGPEAELWMGAHPAAPSDLVVPSTVAAGGVVPLPAAIDADPVALLGPETLERFGPRLPFLLKILAIARPLSVQVHPDAARAAAVHVPGGDSPYVDANHKPELLYALAPTEALFGFRPAGQAAALLERLGAERLLPLAADLAKDDGTDDATRLHTALRTLLTWPNDDRAALVAEVASGVARLERDGATDYPDVFGWVARLVGLHPSDPMVVAPVLLDLLHLAPGDSVFVPAGVPHCYLDGFGVEIMSTSDNVLRCGLTSKAVDVEELLQVVDARPLAAARATRVVLGEHEDAWRMPVDDFRLTRLRVPEGYSVAAAPLPGPQILLCTAGTIRVRAAGQTVELRPGASAYLRPDAGDLIVTGAGELFRAAIG
jgi:mannose-6-phosphate isomerase